MCGVCPHVCIRCGSLSRSTSNEAAIRQPALLQVCARHSADPPTGQTAFSTPNIAKYPVCPTNALYTSFRTVVFEDFIVRWTRGGGSWMSYCCGILSCLPRADPPNPSDSNIPDTVPDWSQSQSQFQPRACLLLG